MRFTLKNQAEKAKNNGLNRTANDFVSTYIEKLAGNECLTSFMAGICKGLLELTSRFDGKTKWMNPDAYVMNYAIMG
jgi:hypothetical protein